MCSASFALHCNFLVNLALLRLSEGENKEKLSAMLEVLESSSPSTTTAELSTYMDGNLMDLLWPLQEKQSSAQKHDSTGSQDGGTLSSSGRPLALEIQDAKHRHSAKQKHDKKGKKPQRVSFTDDDVPNRLSQNKDFDGQRYAEFISLFLCIMKKITLISTIPIWVIELGNFEGLRTRMSHSAIKINRLKFEFGIAMMSRVSNPTLPASRMQNDWMFSFLLPISS